MKLDVFFYNKKSSAHANHLAKLLTINYLQLIDFQLEIIWKQAILSPLSKSFLKGFLTWKTVQSVASKYS